MSGPLDFGASPGPSPEEPPPQPEAEVPPPARPPGASRYGWIAGVAGVIAVAYISVNTLRTDGPGAVGLARGSHLPSFAAPLVLSRLDGDANLAVPGRTGGAAGAVPACSVRRPDVLNTCALGHSAPVVLGFLFTRGARCAASFDALERVRRRTPGVRFAGVIVRGGRDEARTLVRAHRWGFPVAYDRDGAVANRYGVAVCPELVLAYPGGIVRETLIGQGVTGLLERHVGSLVAGSRRRGWSAPR